MRCQRDAHSKNSTQTPNKNNSSRLFIDVWKSIDVEFGFGNQEPTDNWVIDCDCLKVHLDTDDASHNTNEYQLKITRDAYRWISESIDINL